jgi:hypothetical protein
MIRHLALGLLASSASAAPLPRSFTVTSFDRIRVEAPYAVTLNTDRAPFARTEGSPAALDLVDLRVEGRTLIIRQRSGFGAGSAVGPVRISLGTPEIRSASLSGSGSLEVGRMSGLSADVALLGSGRLTVKTLSADRVNVALQGSGALRLGGRTESARLTAQGTGSLEAADLTAEDLTLAAEGAGLVTAKATRQATIAAAGAVQVRVTGAPACTLRVAGSAEVSGCRPQR